MARRIVIMRHGEAVPVSSGDEQRTLTERGEAQVLATARQLIKWDIDRIIASPYVRTQQSANIAGQILNLHSISDPSLVPEADALTTLSELNEKYTGNLLLVSHMPLVGSLSSCLLGSGRAEYVHFGTADALVVETEFLLPGVGMRITSVSPGGVLPRGVC